MKSLKMLHDKDMGHFDRPSQRTDHQLTNQTNKRTNQTTNQPTNRTNRTTGHFDLHLKKSDLFFKSFC